MTIPIILASGSATRAELLRNAGLQFTIERPRVDEAAIKDALQAEQAKPRDVADTLAEIKARKVADRTPEAMVIGCDQILSYHGEVFSKPTDRDDALSQLLRLRGQRHSLLSAAVIYHEGQPVWRHVGEVKLRMRQASDAYLRDYVSRQWDSIQHSVGGYQIESEGVRLFHSIEGDYFHILGMPLLEVLAFLTLRGVIEG